MSGELTPLLAFGAGIGGALHCLGMCSGLAGGLFAGSRRVRVRDILLYHGARILTYGALGVAGAALGRVLVLTGVVGKAQGVLMMAAGVLIVAVGLRMLLATARVPSTLVAVGGGGFAAPAPLAAPGVVAAPRLPFLGPAPRGERAIGPRAWPTVGGLLNGLMPCGLVFSVAVRAAAGADPLQAGLLMTAFGLGTLPTLVALSLAGGAVGTRARGAATRLAGLAVVALGAWTLYEGFTFFHIMRGLADW